MSTCAFRPSLAAVPVALALLAVLAAVLAAGCSAPPEASPTAASTDAVTAAAAAPRKYAAIVGTWKATGTVPPASPDGIPAYATYTFDPDGTFHASRSCRGEEDAGAVRCDATVTVSGTWQIFTTLPELPRIDLTFSWTRETYVFSMQCDLLVLDGIDALFQHELGSLPRVADGAVCEDMSWSSIGVCPRDIGACDHETHRCLQAS